jgi:hypothetical protein
MISYISEHDDGAGQEKTVETALIRETDRAITPQGRAQEMAESCCNYSATEEREAPQRPGRNLPFGMERAKDGSSKRIVLGRSFRS